jgi:hypothetical protein
MYVDFDYLDDEIRVWLHVYDSRTDTNWAAELHGTPSEIHWLGRKSAHLMDGAGFVPGWSLQAKYCRSIDYLILVREAFERCWWKSFNK